MFLSYVTSRVPMGFLKNFTQFVPGRLTSQRRALLCAFMIDLSPQLALSDSFQSSQVFNLIIQSETKGAALCTKNTKSVILYSVSCQHREQNIQRGIKRISLCEVKCKIHPTVFCIFKRISPYSYTCVFIPIFIFCILYSVM